MGEKLVKEYVKDILLIIAELEQIKKDAKTSKGFSKGIYYKRTSERNFLIIGELIKNNNSESRNSIKNKEQRKHHRIKKFFGTCL